MQRNKLVLVIMLSLCMIMGGILFFFLDLSDKKTLPDDLYDKFGCGRTTLDARYTDKYCYDYEFYKKDHAAGKI